MVFGHRNRDEIDSCTWFRLLTVVQLSSCFRRDLSRFSEGLLLIYRAWIVPLGYEIVNARFGVTPCNERQQLIGFGLEPKFVSSLQGRSEFVSPTLKRSTLDSVTFLPRVQIENSGAFYRLSRHDSEESRKILVVNLEGEP